MVRKLALPLLLCAAILLAPSRLIAITMAWSPVGNPGNAADPSTGYGAVSYSYSIGTYDVTNSQYAAFLNANDPTGADPLALYDTDMSNAMFGGVNYNSGAPPGSRYSVVSGNGNNPVNFISWYDAIRFANWMNNGQPVFATEPTATNNATENGSYTLDGFEPNPSNGNSVTRNAGSVIVLPSENEWYKAAYYNPATGSYFTYSTSSNTAPNAVAPTGAPANSANFDEAVGNLTSVGAYSLTTSPYGAYDMGGDLFQWNEAFIDGFYRGARGGSFAYDAFDMSSSYRFNEVPSDSANFIGFRLAMVPEPSSIVLAILGCVGAFALRNRLQYRHD